MSFNSTKLEDRKNIVAAWSLQRILKQRRVLIGAIVTNISNLFDTSNVLPRHLKANFDRERGQRKPITRPRERRIGFLSVFDRRVLEVNVAGHSKVTTERGGSGGVTRARKFTGGIRARVPRDRESAKTPRGRTGRRRRRVVGEGGARRSPGPFSRTGYPRSLH